MKILGIIPSRLASTRFPEKPLVDINGKTMVQRVYEQAKKSKLLSDVVIATDHEKIYNHALSFGGKVMMTSSSHQSGTDRCAEIAEKVSTEYDFIINIQGDEPFIHPEQIDELASVFDANTELATLFIKSTNDEEVFSPNSIKLVFDKNFNAIYFSRNTIPFVRNSEKDNWTKKNVFFRHIGMYGYRIDVLQKVAKLPQSHLELMESLEQLRWIENGYKIKLKETLYESVSIDVPDDLNKLRKLGFI